MLSIPMDPEIERHLEALGATTAEGKAKLARERLLEALEEAREDQEWARIAEERLARSEETCSLEEVARDLDVGQISRERTAGSGTTRHDRALPLILAEEIVSNALRVRFGERALFVDELVARGAGEEHALAA